MPDQKINGKQHYLCHAVDQDGEVVDVLLHLVEMAQQLNASLKGYCVVMLASREK